MVGRAEVNRLEKSLDATFKRAKTPGTDPELQSDLARYLCVLVSGFLEQAIIELLIEHVRARSAPTIQRYLERRLRKFSSPKTSNLVQLLGGFSSKWSEDISGYCIDAKKDAVDSIVALRHTIAHGGFVTVTLNRIEAYYKEIKSLIKKVEQLCA